MKFNIQHTFSAQESIDLKGEFLAGDRIALLGKSGAGKTTLLRYLSGLNQQGSVDIEVHGSKNPKIWHSPTVLLHQQPVLFPRHTVEQTLRFGKKYAYTDEADLPFEQWLAALELTPLLKKNCHQLSGGQAQRVALLRALMTQTPWLLLDEPFSALDAERMVNACRVMAEYCAITGAGIVMASHADYPQRFLCDKAYVVDNLNGKPVDDVFAALNKQSQDRKVATLSVNSKAVQHGFLSAEVDSQALYLREPTHWVNGSARVSIDADNVSIAIGDTHSTSMVNRLHCVIESCEVFTSGAYCLCLKIDEQCLFAKVSQWSFERLQLRIGQSVFAEFKVGAVQWHGQATQ